MNDEECVPGRLRLSLCERHYRRQLHTGTTASLRIDNLANYTVSSEDECWHWQGALWPNGYGKTSVKIHGTRIAHRAFYAEHVGKLGADLDVDHGCHNADPTCVRGHECRHRRCVNPAHLEAVPHVENLLRAIQSRQVCENGLHDLTAPGAVTPGTRQCVECWRARYRAAGKRYRQRKQEI